MAKMSSKVISTIFKASLIASSAHNAVERRRPKQSVLGSSITADSRCASSTMTTLRACRSGDYAASSSPKRPRSTQTAADLIGAFATLAPPVVWVVDLGTVLLLFMVLGWSGCCCRDWLWRRFRAWGCFRSGRWWLGRLLYWALPGRSLTSVDGDRCIKVPGLATWR